MPEGPARAVRASDEDRERVVVALKEHCTAGRLTVDELTDRVARAYRARTLLELAELTADLPGRLPPSPAAPADRHFRSPRMPGVVPFAETMEVDRPRTEVLSEALREIAPRLSGYGFELVDTGPERLAFVRTERPAWTILVAIFAFPIGLLALFHKRTHRVQLALDELGDSRTRLTIHGSAPLAIRRAFAELRA